MSAHPTEGLRRERLPNGVTLLVQRRRSAPAAALVTHVRAGFLDEPDDVAGISHVLEHMLFKGTPSLGPGELARRTKALGGSLNAYTSYDRTVYYATVPARHAIEAVALQADQVRNPLFDPEELRRELGVIIQEARRKLDTPSAVAGERLHELLFDAHRIRRWRIGTEPVLEAFRREDVAAYHASRYTPGRVIVTLVGDLDEDEALAALREKWGDWSRPDVPIAVGPPETARAEMRALRLSGDVSQAEVVLGWRGTGPLAPDAPALDLVSALLTSGRGSRLQRLLREPGIVAGVGASHYGAEDVGVFALGAELEPARLAQALPLVLGAVRDLAEREVSDRELDRVRTLMLLRMRRRLERYESRATALAGAEADGDVSHLDREESELLAVTPADVREVAARYLAPDAFSAVAYMPQQDATPFDLAELLRTRSAPPVAPEPSDEVAWKPRPTAPIARVTRRTAHGVHHLALPGLDLLTARHGDVPQVSLAVYRRRAERERLDNAGLAALAVRTMVRGTTDRDAAQLALAMESLGGVLSPSLGGDVVAFGASIVAERVSHAAELLRDVLTAPRFDPAAIEIERALLLDDARAVADDMGRFPFQLALSQAFNDSGYGAPALGTAESLAALTEQDVRNWHQRALAKGPTTVVAVGDTDPEALADELAAVFSGIGSDAPDAPPGMAALIAAGQRVEHRDRQQSALAMIFPGPARTDPARFAAEVWSAIAGGLGGRLFESLRSARSLAYTVMASSWQRREAGALLTYIAMAPERLDEARDAMLEELAAFRAAPPSADELQRAVAMLAGQAEIARQGAGALAGEIADAWLLGEGLIELDDPGAPYRSVTAEAVHAVASASLDPARRAEGVVAAGLPG
ncbi:MAG: pitrilysin family protein [Gemmatimonadales bacterium]